MKDKELAELKSSFVQTIAKLKEITANQPQNSPEYVEREMMIRAMEYTHRRIDYLAEAFFNYKVDHTKGHLPPINSPAKMEEALAALGLEGDYQVYKPTIVVASTNKGLQINASFQKNEKKP